MRKRKKSTNAKKPNKPLRITILLAVLVLLAGGGYCALLRYTAYARVMQMNSNAKTFYAAVRSSLIALEQHEMPQTITTTIYHKGELHDGDVLWETIRGYYSNVTELDYAFVCDEDGTLLYTLCSKKPLDEAHLEKMTWDEQFATAENPLHSFSLVGCHPQ